MRYLMFILVLLVGCQVIEQPEKGTIREIPKPPPRHKVLGVLALDHRHIMNADHNLMKVDDKEYFITIRALNMKFYAESNHEDLQTNKRVTMIMPIGDSPTFGLKSGEWYDSDVVWPKIQKFIKDKNGNFGGPG